jgi:hypothetical protein
VTPLAGMTVYLALLAVKVGWACGWELADG